MHQTGGHGGTMLHTMSRGSGSIDVSAELDRFREKLLDLSNMNRLLNYHKSTARTIQIVDELPNNIFERLVVKERPFSFLPKTEELEERAQSQLTITLSVGDGTSAEAEEHELPPIPDGDQARSRRHTDDKLQTDKTEKQLERVLTVMRQEANAAIEETGVNYLYLALGMLEWREQDTSDRIFLAPLILLPLRFERNFDARANKYRITIVYSGEDIQQNLCLAKRLEKDFGLVLPDYVSDDDAGPLMPEDYFARVAAAVVSKSNWRIKREALIGFFSFRKLLMYLDLDPNNWKGDKAPDKHPLVRAVVEGGQFDESPSFFASDYNVDEYPTAHAITLVRDADSSQHSALCDIAEGKNLVIEGPPGTGKSQTISNAIANALCEGKRVLFVAEKLAALEVVRGNLEKVGLGIFCLELHSEAAKPRQVFEDLSRRLNSHFRSPSGLESLQARIDAQKAKLKNYLDATCGLVGPQRQPLYEVFWRITELRSRGLNVLPHVRLDTSFDEFKFDEAKASLAELTAHAKELGDPSESAWHGYRPNRLPPSGHRVVGDILADLKTLAESIASKAASLVTRFGGENAQWIEIANDSNAFVDCDLKAPIEVDRSLLPFLQTVRHCELATAAATAVADCKAEVRAASQLVVDEIAAAQPAAMELKNELAPKLPKTLVDISLAKCRELRGQLDAAIQAFTTFDQAAVSLTSLGFGDVKTLRDFDDALYRYRLVSHEAVAPPRTIAETYFHAGAPAVFQRGRKTATTLCDRFQKIEEHVYREKLPEDGALVEICDVLKAFGGSWTRIFRGQYRRVRKTIRSFAKPTSRRTRVPEWITIITDVRTTNRDVERLTADGELRRYFGPHFSGLDTDWQSLELSLSWVNTARKSGLGYSRAAELIGKRWQEPSAPDPQEALAAGKNLRLSIVQPAIRECVGLDENTMVAAPLDKLRNHFVALTRFLDRIFELRRSFAADDSATLSHLCAHSTQVLKALENADALHQQSAYCMAFPKHYTGVDTDDVKLKATATWLSRMFALRLPKSAIDQIANDSSGEQAISFLDSIRNLGSLQGQWTSRRNQLVEFGTADEAWLKLPGASDDITNVSRIRFLQAQLQWLPPWSSLCRAIERAVDLGVGDFAMAVYDGRLAATFCADCFDLTFHEQLATEVIEQSAILRTFSRQGMDHARSEFKSLDHQLIKANQELIAFRASKRQPPVGVTTGRVKDLTEMGLIRNEVGKQRRHCRIRDLISRAGRAVQALKPCFMMSPLSIAQYLPAGNTEFDLVVMDEASQIKPEDALGTLIRAKQIVVVGDPKQLPPTSFFDRISQTDEGDDSTFLDDTESILEVAMKAFPHRRRLRWHYRSQHESLIAFSNERFYDGDLVVFPSPTVAAGRLGLRFHAVENATFSGGCNPVEAKAVADAIIRHALESPGETLGVAAFNAKQAQEIQKHLDEACERTEVRVAVERLGALEDGLFIKNLESVQGDERDVIFISYTYGPEPTTNIVMNRFGPINGENGWRRLNVLVTRAKRRVEVFSSMKPDDIKGGVERSRGVNAMRDYLNYVVTGQLVDRGCATGRDPDSPFELSVARAIEGLGLKVTPQVGVAGYFVDLGIHKPGSDGEFLLGIECDGATYHSSKSARDRDRLREDVITARGWKLHRIWSTDWFLNQEAEVERLRTVIRQRLSACTL